MKSILGFFSLLAFGFLAAGVLAVIATSSGSQLPFAMPSGEGLNLNGKIGLDLPSLLIGLACGHLAVRSRAHLLGGAAAALGLVAARQ